MEPAVAERYVERIDGEYRIAGTRVSLGSVVSLFLDGRSPESIGQAFPVLRLEQIYGALAYYLAHRPEIDAHLGEQRAPYEAARRQSHESHEGLVRRLHAARAQRHRAVS